MEWISSTVSRKCLYLAQTRREDWGIVSRPYLMAYSEVTCELEAVSDW